MNSKRSNKLLKKAKFSVNLHLTKKKMEIIGVNEKITLKKDFSFKYINGTTIKIYDEKVSFTLYLPREIQKKKKEYLLAQAMAIYFNEKFPDMERLNEK